MADINIQASVASSVDTTDYILLAPGATGTLEKAALSALPVSTPQATALALKLTASNNLSDIASKSTAKTNLGLGAIIASNISSTTTINVDTCYFARLTLSENTSLILTGTPTDGQIIRIRVKASGGTRTITLGSSFRTLGTDPISVASGTKTHLAFTWDSEDSKWDVVAEYPGFS